MRNVHALLKDFWRVAQLYQMQLLTWNCQPGDSLFFHYSGAAPPPFLGWTLAACFVQGALA